MEFVMEDWLVPSSFRWPDAENGPWTVTLAWRALAGRAECVGLSLSPVDAENAEPLTATRLRSLPLARLITKARRARFEAAGGRVLEGISPDQTDVGESVLEELHAVAEPWDKRRPSRPVTLGLEHHREVARIYSNALAAGGSPLRAVEQWGTVSRPTASRWVAAARAAGLLPPTERGRAKGNEALPETEQEEQR